MTAYPGHYFDGKTAARREVTVSAAANGLVVVGADGKPVGLWRYRTLTLAEEVLPGRPLRLRPEAAAAESLLVADHGILAELTPLAPNLLPSAAARVSRGMMWGLGGALSLAALAALVFFGVPPAARFLAGLVPPSWEARWGRSIERQVVELFGLAGEGDGARVCVDAAGRAAFEKMLRRIAAESDAPYDFRLLVVDSEAVNAFALPGGGIVFFHGLLDFAEGPGEVAGVLAHEVGHVIHRHGTEALMKGFALDIAVNIVTGGGWSGDIGKALIGSSYSRDAESEADATGLALMAAAGYDGRGMAAFLHRLEEKEGDIPGALALLSSHPLSARRAAIAEATAQPGAPPLSPDEWKALQAICDETEAYQAGP